MLFDVCDIKQVHWHWKRCAALSNLSIIMANYLKDSVKSDSHYFIDMKFLLTDLQKQFKLMHGGDAKDVSGMSVLVNFMTSIVMICINDAFHSLDPNGQSPTKNKKEDEC